MVTYNINLDLVKDTYTNFKCKQNDDIVLKFNIYNNSLIEDLTGSTVILNALRNNNTFVKQTNNIVIDKNIITINCSRDITRVGGKLKLELVIIKDSKQTTTFNIDVTVVNSVITDNAEASKNVVSVIEELDNKIAQGKEIVAEVDRKKNEAIDTVVELKTDTVTSVTNLKDTTIEQFNATKKDVEILKQQTIEECKNVKDNAIEEINKIKLNSIADLETTTKEIEELKNITVTESTNIKDSTIEELSKIKLDSITELTKIKESSNIELNNIKNTVDADLKKIKEETITEVINVANKTIEEINKYNIEEVNKKIDTHLSDIDSHVTKELKDFVKKNKDNTEEVNSKIDTHIQDQDLHVTKELKDSVDKKSSRYYIINESDPNLVLEEKFRCKHVNCPSNDYYFIENSMCDNETITTHANRTQIACGCSNVNNIYVRTKFNGAWSAWREVLTEKGGELKGILTAHSNTSYAVRQVRNIILSSLDANNGVMGEGDIWIKYK